MGEGAQCAQIDGRSVLQPAGNRVAPPAAGSMLHPPENYTHTGARNTGAAQAWEGGGASCRWRRSRGAARSATGGGAEKGVRPPPWEAGQERRSDDTSSHRPAHALHAAPRPPDPAPARSSRAAAPAKEVEGAWEAAGRRAATAGSSELAEGARRGMDERE
jgi:hypothetical protein